MKSKQVDAKGIVFDTKFHPTQDILATGTIEGLLSFHSTNDTPELLFSHLHHESSCRSLDFTPDGTGLYSVSSDLRLLMTSIEHEKVVMEQPKAHSEPLNKVKALEEFVVCTGDDGGAIKLWDLRTKKCERKYKEQVDYISDFAYQDYTLLATSGDGCLAVFDTRMKKPLKVSDNQDDELLSISIVRNRTKAVVGTISGTLLLFSWNNWGDCSDRFPGHPESVSCLVKANDTTLYTGSGDGIVRAVGILPNTLLANITPRQSMPIEAMSLSSDKNWLAVACHDEIVSLWEANIDATHTDVFPQDQKRLRESSDESDDSDDSDDSETPKPKRKTKKSFTKNTNSFFDGLD